MSKLMNGVLSKVSTFLASRRFYWGVVAFFVFEALWIALSANYPMAFDEDFHLGVINVYAQQWSPFLSSQPEGANAYGALATDPSYLYHYLMSFPYRFISLFTDSQAAQVVFLRVLNIAMITAGVILFRKVLLRAGTSPLITNLATLLFALVPTVPLLAGQINYDNLLVLAFAGVCWLVLRITEDLKARKVNLALWLWLAILLMLASLVKYAFLPVALAVVVYLTVLVCQKFVGRWQLLGKRLKKDYSRLGNGAKIGLLVAFLLTSGLFLQRYGVNAAKYGHPVPDCDAVIGVEACMEYGPWGRNYRFAAENRAVDSNPLAYTSKWVQALHYRLFFTVSGPPNYVNYPPALLPSAAAIAVFVFGALALLFYWREVFRGRPFLVFILAASLIYIAVLWSQTYEQYVDTGQPVAINGRYLIPLLLPLAAVFGRGLNIALGAWPAAKKWGATLVILLFLQGGGVFSFILRSDASWYWPNQAVSTVNEAAQNGLSKVMFIGPKYY